MWWVGGHERHALAPEVGHAIFHDPPSLSTDVLDPCVQKGSSTISGADSHDAIGPARPKGFRTMAALFRGAGVAALDPGAFRARCRVFPEARSDVALPPWRSRAKRS